MEPTLQPDGTLLVPARAEGPNGLIGDAMLPLPPDAPDYADRRAGAELSRVPPGVVALALVQAFADDDRESAAEILEMLGDE